MKKQLFMIMIGLFAIILAACGASSDSANEENTSGAAAESEKEEMTITHELGETTFEKNPESVVVFDFGTLDSLDALGVEIAGIPQENVPSYLSKYEGSEYENTGSLKEPDFEKINEMQPDLIIISGRQAELYDEFHEIAPTIFMGVDTSRYMESFEENVTTLGEIFGKEEEAADQLAVIEQSINQLQEKVKAEGKNALITLANDGKVSAYGAGSRFGIIHDVFGFTPVDENIEVSTHGQSISFEYIVEKDPEYLFVVDRGAAVADGESSAKQVVENELVQKTKAFQNDHIVYLDPDYWYLSGGGLVSVQEMVNEIEAGL
ncbi:siderophore ABC transporter substrate-binding protein [Jeotgalibacillus soli]|uniref:Periplasmic binding protein n=1 Tax=Jeotgalibacillus soli TaxID=889306 RepID=A0A0C2RLQ3_9BACL|nr:siderophore ABC transporter substrate-binding protein [Jeotgalibacillus soli]KIL42684.1 periplasmic binding protein [Jeotgalibacillus soli]